MSRAAPDHHLGAQEPAATDDEFVCGRIADHHACDVVRRVRPAEIVPGSAEAAGVLIRVEQQRKGAVEHCSLSTETYSNVQEDSYGRFGIGCTATIEPAVFNG